mmetsp:Transcript_33937/g.108307  ORF Transcript_33937/g.108307 Transcript_33937/m.108307 type:complete len:261 (-) Transcript_33937:180-962(-)
MSCSLRGTSRSTARSGPPCCSCRSSVTTSSPSPPATQSSSGWMWPGRRRRQPPPAAGTRRPPRSGSGSGSDSDSGKAGRRSYYKQIGRVKFDRALLDCAEDLAAANGGTLGAEEAKRLLADARDGPGGVTDWEERTLTYIAEKSRLSPGAKEVLGKGDAAVNGARAPAAERGELDLSRYEFPDEGVAKAEATKNAVLKVAGGKGMPLPRAGEDGGLPSFSGLSRTARKRRAKAKETRVKAKAKRAAPSKMGSAKTNKRGK